MKKTTQNWGAFDVFARVDQILNSSLTGDEHISKDFARFLVK